MAEKVTLICEECFHRNYSTSKNKQTMVKRIELKKFCRNCKKHTLHKETK
ncbi:MAG: 50S ribosomal protein L33 [Culicoidibacterales bacterium]